MAANSNHWTDNHGTGKHWADSHWTELSSRNERLAQIKDASSAGSAGVAPASAGAAAMAPAGRGQGGGWQRRGGVAAGAAALAAAAVAIAGAGTAGAAQAASAPAAKPASWHIVKRLGGNVAFTAVTAAGRSGGWAFANGFAAGTRTTAWQRSGSSWSEVAFPFARGAGVTAAGASSARDAWAFTDGSMRSRVVHWNGSRWSVVKSFARTIGSAVVVSRSDVWAFGSPYAPGSGLGTWHFNGRSWSLVRSGSGLLGGSALSAGSVWAFGGTSVAHWNGHVWARTSVRGLLPARQGINSPAVAAVYAQSANSVWAVGDGYRQDEGGPVVVLHYNGHRWSRVARSNVLGFPATPQLAPDGHGGLWIPVGPTAGGSNAHLLHYSGGQLTAAVLPSGANRIDVLSVAGVPATTMALAAGFSYSGALGSGPATGVILQYGG